MRGFMLAAAAVSTMAGQANAATMKLTASWWSEVRSIVEITAIHGNYSLRDEFTIPGPQKVVAEVIYEKNGGDFNVLSASLSIGDMQLIGSTDENDDLLYFEAGILVDREYYVEGETGNDPNAGAFAISDIRTELSVGRIFAELPQELAPDYDGGLWGTFSILVDLGDIDAGTIAWEDGCPAVQTLPANACIHSDVGEMELYYEAGQDARPYFGGSIMFDGSIGGYFAHIDYSSGWGYLSTPLVVSIERLSDPVAPVPLSASAPMLLAATAGLMALKSRKRFR